MIFPLPEVRYDAVKLSYFPTKHQAFIFRAIEYVSAEKIAKVLKTTAENVRSAARDMGLPDCEPCDKWMNRGYITIIRRLWHILPYSQLLELLEMDEAELSSLMRDEDFLIVKLGHKKPSCETVYYRPLSDTEIEETEKARLILSSVDEKVFKRLGVNLTCEPKFSV